MTNYTIDQLARFIDHTNLKPDATYQDMETLCDEAKQYHFKMVAVNQVQSKICSNLLNNTDISVGAAISFPLGQTTKEVKVLETKNAIENGATEIDYVVNLTEVKGANWSYIENEMESIVSICKINNVISKVIFENAYLTNEEIIKLAEISKKVKPDFIKTSTGFAPTGATYADVKLMKKYVGNNVKVKAAGGIRDLETFKEMIACGAERIGTSSGIEIIKQLNLELLESGSSYISI